MDKNSNDNTQSKDKTPQNEVALNALRDQALHHLLSEGREARYSSQATANERGIRIETSDNKTHQKTEMQVSAGEMSEGLSFSPFGKKGSTDVKVSDGKSTENDHIEFSYGIFQREDQGHVSIERKDQNGKVIQTAEGDYDKFGHGHNAPNTTEVDYKIHDAKLGELNLNEVVTANGNGSRDYRSVIRDNANHVLGIIEQNATLDANGNLKQVDTLARTSKFQGQVKPPTE